ncbi:MAG: phosphatase PAP2 family protein [Steroidobacteraceae bacterium]|jgi:undecaprenyl-diphosphatase
MTVTCLKANSSRLVAMNRAQLIMARFDIAEYWLCRRLNRGAGTPAVRVLLRIASRLGDGIAWYVLVGVLPLIYGRAALRPAIGMALTGIIGLLIYRRLKHALVRERPFIRHPGITLAMPPLDRYSFPSGHTLHAVAFTWQAVANFPELAWVLVPLASLIAASRVVLGLHYPSDVLVGGAIGGALALPALYLF